MNKTHLTNSSDVPAHEHLGLPVDPTAQLQAFRGDTYDLTGISADSKYQLSVVETEADAADDSNVLGFDSARVRQKIKSLETRGGNPDDELLEKLGHSGNHTLHAHAAPSVVGEQSVSGDMSDPESDDDTLLNSHQMGLRLDEDEENPQELNMAADIAAAELARQGSLDIHDDSDL